MHQVRSAVAPLLTPMADVSTPAGFALAFRPTKRSVYTALGYQGASWLVYRMARCWWRAPPAGPLAAIAGGCTVSFSLPEAGAAALTSLDVVRSSPRDRRQATVTSRWRFAMIERFWSDLQVTGPAVRSPIGAGRAVSGRRRA